MTRLVVPLITLGLFIALSVHAWHKHPPQHRVTMSQGEFVAQKVSEYDTGVFYRTRERTVLVWSDKKAALLAEALSLTPDGIDATVDVRRQP